MTLLAANTAEKPDFAKEKSTSTNNTQAEGRDSSEALTILINIELKTFG